MNQKTTVSTQQNLIQEVNWYEIVRKYLVHWRWIAASVVVFLIAGYLFVQTQPEQYRSNASILVIDQKKSGTLNELSMLKDLGVTAGSSVVDNEVEVVRSQPLALEVVRQLKLHTSYYKQEFLAKRSELYTESPISVEPDSVTLGKLEYSVTMTLTPEDGNTFSVKGTYGQDEFSATVEKLPAVIQSPAGNLIVALREGSTLPDYPVEVVVRNPGDVADDLAAAVQTVVSSKKSDVINLTYTSFHKQKAKDILNALVAAYNQDAMSQINFSAINTASFIDERLKYLTGELSEVERSVERYKKSNKLTDISSEAQLVLQNNSLYEKKQAEVETQINLVKYVEEFIKNSPNRNALIPNLGLTDMGLVAVINGYNELILKRERILRGSSEENPLLKELNAQIQSARKAIESSIGSSRRGLMITRSDLQRQDNLTMSRINQVPRQEREFIEIKRQQQIKESLYIFLLQKREEAALTMAVTVPKARVINPANKALQVAPKKPIILLAFLLLGLLIPIALIYLRDMFNTSFAGRGEVEKLTEVPVLSELGHNDSSEILIDHSSQIDVNAELFRLLRTKLQLALDYPKEKVIMVTSTVPGEGKTYVSLNLAVAMSKLEKKILLIGLDLRKPQLAYHLNYTNEKGISAYLSGQEQAWQNLTFSPPQFEGLDILPAGVVPPNPSELIQRKRLDDLIEEARKHYDYIILDSAPVGAVSDSLLLDRLSCINLWVCRANYSHKNNIHLVNRIYQEKSLTPLYILVNDVKYDPSLRTYGSYFQYGYSYGYSHKKKADEAKIKTGVEGLKKRLMEIGKN